MVRLIGSKQKDTMGNFISPSSGVRDTMQRNGFKPRDHAKDNVRAIRETEERQRQMRQDAEAAPAPLFKMAQFKEVSSRVFEGRPTDKREEEHAFLERRRSEKRIDDIAMSKRIQRLELEARLEDDREKEGKPPTPRKPLIPRAAEFPRPATKLVTNYIGKNIVKAQVQLPVKRETPLKESPSRHESFGRVPDYLEQRQLKWAEEKERVRRNAPDPSCPPGMRLMPEDERLDTLEKLFSSQSEVLALLQSMPFIIETQSQKNRQFALDSKLRDIENAIKIFDKPRVYIAAS